jgi:hypothetical protein
LLFIKNSDIKQKLMNINKKLKWIDSNTFKTKTDIDTYAIAVKKSALTKLKKRKTRVEDSSQERNSEIFLRNSKKEKRWWWKSTTKKKNVYTIFIYQESYV